MKTKYFIFAASALVALASCSNDEYVGDNNGLTAGQGDGSIQFSYTMPNATRADIAGSAAATLLNNNFYVMGTKGTEASTSPTPTLVFDNYLVHYGENTAGTTESNTANWEYVGINPGTAPCTGYVFLSSMAPKRTQDVQTIKYWDYSVPQYDFYAFSTGSKTPVTNKNISTIGDDEINVTEMKYGAALAGATAYTFIIPNTNALKEAYITDITEVLQANYGNDVVLKFKSLGSKVRVALYETVPGYSVKNVKFYAVDNDAVKSGQTGFEAPTTTATLISAATGGIPNRATIEVKFPHIGNSNASEADYDKASATVTPVTITDPSDPSDPGFAFYDKAPTFGTLAATKLVAKQKYEAGDDNVFLGRSLPNATFAGDKDAQFYTNVFPVSDPSALTLRVDYTLVPIDGAEETINVYGARAVVPSTYTTWLPNYAYTYVFKISDNTNGWTNQDKTKAGLFPITFDAVVTEATDATAEQKTITTVATPSITTYQQDHYKDASADEYSIARAKDIYVQVMNNSAVPASMYANLGETIPGESPKVRSLLYDVTNAVGTTPISEATVMDAITNQYSVSGGDITGRNGILLTKMTNIDATVTSIVNGADDNPISVSAGEAAEITISGLTATHTYAYIYDYSSAAKVTKDIYQMITPGAKVGTTGKTYYYIAKTAIDGATETSEDEAVGAYVYFSVTTNGTGDKTYSYYSVEGKTNLPAGLKKIAKTTIASNSVDGNTDSDAANVYFDKYINNDGKYAVKVIKIVA